TPWDKLREECGVFGVRTEGAPAAPLAHLGLYALQHRGQESAGIATFDGARTHLVKDMGLVAAVFTPNRLETLSGATGIGRVRYSRMGSASLENAQPFLEQSPWGTLALAHNGNLVNGPSLRRELEDAGHRFRATSDTEVITKLIAASTAPTLEDAVAGCMRRISGAYTVVAMARDTLVAFRDANGIRPLALGRLGRAVVFASESCAFDQIGGEYLREVRPGELVVADASGIPGEVGLIKNRYVGRTFIQPDPSSRDFGVRVKLNPIREVVAGRRIVLVDDSIVRGTTSRQIVRMLRRTGAREIHFRVSSPPILNACYYGIDTSSRGELV